MQLFFSMLFFGVGVFFFELFFEHFNTHEILIWLLSGYQNVSFLLSQQKRLEWKKK